MNGMILQSSPEGKDIKFNDKKNIDTTQEEAGELFENLITSLVEDDKKGKSSSFLLGKLLNISSDLENRGKKISEFSKGELLEQLKTTSDTKSNKNDDKDELVVLEELFKIALTLKAGDMPDIKEIQSEPLKVALTDKAVINELKSAKNIKELLSIADKNGIKVKNFQFFIEEAALNPEDKKIVHKVTSQDIFKMIEPKVQSQTQYKASTQSVLTKLINKEIPIKDKDIKVSEATSSLQNVLKQENKTPSSDIKDIKVEPNLVDEKITKLETIKPTISKKTHTTEQQEVQSTKQPKEITKTPSTDIKVKSSFEEEKMAELETIKPIHSKKRETVHQKAPQNTLADLLKNSQTTSQVKKSEDVAPLKEENVESIKESPSEKSSTTMEIKTETTIKTKEHNEVKKSLNTFATEFKEKVQSYKSPLMKIKMQLSPQNLGDVDVTLVNRGSTLQVNITSNNNSMAIFMQNQAEFKNSLVNMGFSDLQMNFSENGSKSQQQQNKKDEKNDNSYENINNEEESDSVEIILPNYV